MTERSASTDGPGCDPGPLSFPALEELGLHRAAPCSPGCFFLCQVGGQFVRARIDPPRLTGDRIERHGNGFALPGALKRPLIREPQGLP